MADEQTCKTCRWWAEDTIGATPADGMGACLKTEVIFGQVQQESTNAFAMPANAPNTGVLVTYPEFSCNQWQSKSDGEVG